MMRTALYYPHTEVRSASLVRDALLTWDHLEYIAPYDDYKPQYQDREVAEAMDIVGRGRVPSKEDQDRVHELVVDLFDTDEIPAALLRDGMPEYELWIPKFSEDTWKFLQQKKVISAERHGPDAVAGELGGLTVMALLADVMAGQTRSRITDRESAYQRIAHLPDRRPREGEELQSIAPITFKALSLENVPLRKVIDYRKREISDRSGDFTTLRHKYREALEKQAAAMVKYPKGSSDRKLAEEEFEADMRHDCAALRTELGFAKKEAWQSKDFVTLALMGGTAAVAALVPGMSIPVAAVSAVALPFVGVLGSTSKLAKARRDLLANHSMAYLYELKGSL